MFFLNSIMFAAPIDRYPFSTEKQHQQFESLITELRCLVCQNENLADSNADLAKDLRQQIYQMIQEKKTDAEIKNYLVVRYGHFILFRPPLQVTTYILWFAPFILLILGFSILAGLAYRRTSK